MAAAKGNKYALGNNGGRPPHYETAEHLKEKIEQFFNFCMRNKEKPTITGLALYLGFESRQSIEDYIKKDEFTYTLKRAKLTVEYYYEKHGETIDIFALKQMGWRDKIETGLTDKDGNDINPFLTINIDKLEQISRLLNDTEDK